MIQFVKKWVGTLVSFVWPQKAIVKRKRAKRHEKKHYGAHYYLGDLLDKLDQAFADFSKFRKADRDAYNLFSKVGATVTSNDGSSAYDQLEPHLFYKGLPSFGAIHVGSKNNPASDAIYPSFIYFQKTKNMPNVQPCRDETLKIGAIYDFDGHVVCDNFAVGVSNNGHVYPLKQVCVKVQAPAFRRKYKSDTGPRIQRASWDFPPILHQIGKKDSTPQARASELFCILANSSSAREAGLTVRIKKGARSAVFAIDMLRTPYFFADREKAVGDSGQTKKIFHIVRGHYRTMPGGQQRFIKSHFRGLRKFNWNGYDVTVSLAGKHHGQLSTFRASGIDEINRNDFDGMLTNEDVGDKFDAYLEGDMSK